ncbi:tail fiber protein [Paenibacillus xylanexedens]|uniref:tail fiber protein n=1 Tax=Paenibacillus xylanexedens TaxID=528191 RepID=UPI001F42C328|nr:tail fiber protein [Paenibacillus xylanexedens]
MSSFSANGLTNKGRNLQAKAQAGVQLLYTKAVAGDGTLGNQSIAPLTNVISPKKTFPLTRFKATGTMARIGFDLSNQDITTGFYFREIGIFANDPDEGEILYWYANAGATADYIPPGGGSDILEKTFDLLVFVGNAPNVSAIIDESLTYATVEALDDALEAAKAYTDSKFSQIIIQDASLTQKGVVQLSNSTTSTSQSLAATAKAVNDARQSAISTASTDATTKADAAETNAKTYAKNYADGLGQESNLWGAI